MGKYVGLSYFPDRRYFLGRNFENREKFLFRNANNFRNGQWWHSFMIQRVPILGFNRSMVLIQSLTSELWSKDGLWCNHKVLGLRQESLWGFFTLMIDCNDLRDLIWNLWVLYLLIYLSTFYAFNWSHH